MNKTYFRHSSNEFTLIELMIAAAIIAIIAAIALPSYQRQIQKSRRTSAKTALFDLTSRQAKYYSTNNAYATSMTDLGYASAGPIAIPDDASNYYSLALSNTSTTTNFSATATPNGRQATDACGTYTIDNIGNKIVSTQEPKCW